MQIAVLLLTWDFNSLPLNGEEWGGGGQWPVAIEREWEWEVNEDLPVWFEVSG